MQWKTASLFLLPSQLPTKTRMCRIQTQLVCHPLTIDILFDELRCCSNNNPDIIGYNYNSIRAPYVLFLLISTCTINNGRYLFVKILGNWINYLCNLSCNFYKRRRQLSDKIM